MLPSFRVIAATFLCGFVVVFAGLRLAASLNGFHEGLPVMAAHAAPASIAPAPDREARRGLSAVPVMYDLRFAVSTVSPTLVRVAPTMFDRATPPLAQPMLILPPEASTSPASVPAEPAEPEAAVAAIQTDAPVAETPAIVPDAPDEPPAPKAPAIAAIDSQARPETASDWPAAEQPLPAAKAAALEPHAVPSPGAEEPLTQSDPAPVAEEPSAPATSPDSDAAHAVNPAAAPRAKTAPRARAKVVRKKRLRAARQTAAPANPYGYSPRTFGTAPAYRPQ